MTDNKRIKECKRKVIAAINEATLPFAVTELILENVLTVSYTHLTLPTTSRV